ncbi:MAG: DUF72 domain-containing protein [Candidatus Acidiferrum sp.]
MESPLNPHIYVGTCAFTASGWSGAFYPKSMKASEYLRFYAERFDTVEIDSTFYGCPQPKTVANWNDRTPAGFVFSVKVPQICCGVSYVAQSAAAPLSPALDVI